MDQIRANTPAPIKANPMTKLLSVQMSWGNGGCTRAGSPGDQQTHELGPWDAQRSWAMMRANAWGHDELNLFSDSKTLQINIYALLICKSEKCLIYSNIQIAVKVP